MEKENIVDLIIREALINWSLEDITNETKKNTLEMLSKENWKELIYTKEEIRKPLMKPKIKKTTEKKATKLYEESKAIVPRKFVFESLPIDIKNEFTHFVLFWDDDTYLIAANYYVLRRNNKTIVNWAELEEDIENFRLKKFSVT